MKRSPRQWIVLPAKLQIQIRNATQSRSGSSHSVARTVRSERMRHENGARLLRVSQSAVSEQIADLEREVGVKLLTRGRQTIDLTPHGKIFLEEARKVLAAADRADSRRSTFRHAARSL